ncbi:hypothetical protein NIES4073_72340 [Kalymmatonema gypsitolerans NIES-4073]|nr:hypothetical protein NIES4073_72340 [Scytonema sp. NIES-4073]
MLLGQVFERVNGTVCSNSVLTTKIFPLLTSSLYLLLIPIRSENACY